MITQTVAPLKHQHVGLVVFVNRYDGIDLPDDACRILVIDGLPPLKSKYDQYVESINPTSQLGSWGDLTFFVQDKIKSIYKAGYLFPAG